MDRNIRLRSEELGFKIAILALAIWSMYECWQSVFNGTVYHALPTLILVLTLSIQGFSEMAMKRKMITGDEDYKEPNKVLWSVIVIIALVAIVLSIGYYLFLKIN